MKRIAFLAVCLLCTSPLMALPFNDDMVDNQLSTGQVMLPAPKGSVSKGSLKYGPRTKEESLALTNPTKAEDLASSSLRGKRLFQVNCAACHGEIGEKHVVYEAGKYLGAPNIAEPSYHNRTDGSLYSTIHFGNVIMYPVGWKISSDETWDIINYIRDTQKQYPIQDQAK